MYIHIHIHIHIKGDFNVDAILRPEIIDEYGYVYNNMNRESDGYVRLIHTYVPFLSSFFILFLFFFFFSDLCVHSIDPTRKVRDILKDAYNGIHPPTR